MKKQLKLKILFSCVVFGVLLLCQSQSIFAQQDPCKNLGVRRIQSSELTTVNFFRANLNGTIVGEPLSTGEIEAGFGEGEAVAIQISAPYCFYTYVVNVSEWDGTSLQYPANANENIGTKAGEKKQLAFALDNISKTKSTTGREELLILITKNKIESPDLQAILNNSGTIKISDSQSKEGQTLLKENLTEPVPQKPTQSPVAPTPVKKSKFVKVISVGCNIASIFFPFAKIACAATGFGIAKYIQTQGNAIGVAPTAETGQLVFRFSFPVQPKQR